MLGDVNVIRMTWCQANASGPYVPLVVSLGLCDFGFLQLNCDCSLPVGQRNANLNGIWLAQDYSGWIHSYHAIL